jgi:hypothetical protein
MMIAHHCGRGHGSSQFSAYPVKGGATFTGGSGGGWTSKTHLVGLVDRGLEGPIYPVRHLVKNGKKVRQRKRVQP